MCSNKSCKETPNVHVWPVKPAKESSDMQPVEPASYKKMCNDKNCQSTKYYKKKDQMKFPNQQCHISTKGCVVTRSVNLQDATRKRVQ